MIAEIVQQAPPETWAESIGPLVALASLLWGGWQTIRASRKAALLRAAIVGVRAGLDALAKEDAETVKAQIEAAAGGKQAPLNEALKAEVRKTTSAIPVYREPPVLGGLLLLVALLVLPSCVAAEVPHAAARLAATARILEAGARAHDVYASGTREERLAALVGYQDLTAEHRRYAEELVAASGGDMAEVDAIEAAWRQRASERARARREATASVTGTGVPR